MDFRIKKNDFCLIVGPNGCGKTTLFDTIVGNRGLNAGVLFKDTLKPIGYAVQDTNNALFPWLRIKSNIMLPSIRESTETQLEISMKADLILDKFKLKNRVNDYPYNLSGGEKQIVNFIRAISTPGDLFLFDEVFASFHRDSIDKGKNIIIEYLNNQTILFISHSIDDLDLPFNRYFTFKENFVTEISKSEAEKILKNVNEQN